MGSGQADNKHMGMGSDKRYRYTGSHRRAGRGGREVRRTGDRVHSAAASATYGRVALPRQRGQGIRKDPPPWHQRQRKRATPGVRRGGSQKTTLPHLIVPGAGGGQQLEDEDGPGIVRFWVLMSISIAFLGSIQTL